MAGLWFGFGPIMGGVKTLPSFLFGKYFVTNGNITVLRKKNVLRDAISSSGNMRYKMFGRCKQLNVEKQQFIEIFRSRAGQTGCDANQ